MNLYGVCINPNCSISSARPDLDRLYVALDEIDRRHKLNETAEDLLPKLSVYTRYFQSGTACVVCNRPLSHAARPVAGMTDEEEKSLIELSNEALQAFQKLQSLGVRLP